MEYIKGYVNEVERMLKNREFDPETGYQSMLDLYTFIGNYIVHELTMNVDGGMRLSTYFAKDKDTKLFMPMVWDFDLSLGNCSYIGSDFNLPYGQDGPEGWFIKIRGGSFENGDYDGSRKSYYQSSSWRPTTPSCRRPRKLSPTPRPRWNTSRAT